MILRAWWTSVDNCIYLLSTAFLFLPLTIFCKMGRDAKEVQKKQEVANGNISEKI